MADAIRDKYRLRVSSLDLVEALHQGVLDYLQLDRLVAWALQIADDAGWVPVVVTNGAIEQQEAKIKQTGLDRYVADWVISERAGVSKPNPRIFALAAQRVRMRLHGAWIVGDCPEDGHRRRGRDRAAQRLAAPGPAVDRAPVPARQTVDGLIAARRRGAWTPRPSRQGGRRRPRQHPA